MSVQLPNWINDLPSERQEDARRCYVLRLAALHYSEGGHLKTLSTGIGFAPNTLAAYLGQNQPITAEVAVKLEELLGRTLFPRELFRPDLFLTTAVSE